MTMVENMLMPIIDHSMFEIFNCWFPLACM